MTKSLEKAETHEASTVKSQDWVAQTSISVNCLLKLR